MKPLTDEQIKSEAKYYCHSWYSQNPERLVLFARAIEKAHGIEWFTDEEIMNEWKQIHERYKK